MYLHVHMELVTYSACACTYICIYNVHCTCTSWYADCLCDFLSSRFDHPWLWVSRSGLHLSSTCPTAVGQATKHVERQLPKLFLQVRLVPVQNVVCMYSLYIFTSHIVHVHVHVPLASGIMILPT